MRAGSAILFFNPCAPNAPSMTLEAPYRHPIVQKGGIVLIANVGLLSLAEGRCGKTRLRSYDWWGRSYDAWCGVSEVRGVSARKVTRARRRNLNDNYKKKQPAQR